MELSETRQLYVPCFCYRGGGGGLHNMRWDPDHIRHIACAGRLYSLLLQQPEGVHFLQTDARGAILQVCLSWTTFIARALSGPTGVHSSLD